MVTVPPATIVGRAVERQALDDLVVAMLDGTSVTVVIVGEAGVGKTTMLDYVTSTANAVVARIGGVEPEQQLGYAALHRLLRPYLYGVSRLPGPQRDALLTVFGMVSGPTPERFHVGLATLTLLADVATDNPLLCVIDDAQWLDQESLEILAFVCRRLSADAIGVMLSFREPTQSLGAFEGFPVLRLVGLPPTEALLWLDSNLTGFVDPGVKDQIVAETSGNPLALLEAAKGLTADQLAGRRPLPSALPVGERLRTWFSQQVQDLPSPTRQLLLLMSIAPSNDPAVLWRAAATLNLSPTDTDVAVAAGILLSDNTSQFRHPLIRSAVYAGASPADRRRTHGALAEATDRDRDMDRWAWHRASATVGTDDGVAHELDVAAVRRRHRGGHTAEAALLLRAAELSSDPAARARRLLTSGEAQLKAGDVRSAKDRLTDALPGLSAPSDQAAATRALAFVEFSLGNVEVVPPMLLAAAAQVAGASPSIARAARFEALVTAIIGRHRQQGWTLEGVANTVLQVQQPVAETAASDLLMAALATRLTLGYEVAVPLMRAAIAALHSDDLTPDAHLSWAIPGSFVTLEMWDDAARDLLLERLASRERATGDLRSLHSTLRRLVRCYLWRGDFATAAQHHAEASEISVAIGTPDYGFAMRSELLAWQGQEDELRGIAAQVFRGRQPLVSGGYDDLVSYGMLLLELSLGRYNEATSWAVPLFEDDAAPIANSTMPDLIEGAMRSGNRPVAEIAFQRLASRAGAAATPWALGVLARSQALMTDDAGAEALYLQAIELLRPTLQQTEVARTHLLLGEWLRRRRRPTDAAGHLRTAHDMFVSFGAPLFADRARSELSAAGGRVRRRQVDSHEALTPQEGQVARLAAAGNTNTEIASRLFVTSSTVEYHLTRIFRKLGVTSRRELGPILNGARAIR